MQRIAQVIQLSPQDESEYIRLHERVWPEVLATIEQCNIANYSIFLRNGVLFAYFEYHGADLSKDMQKMAACMDTQRWWAICGPMQLPMEDAPPEERWSPMREVFHFSGGTS